MGGGHNGLICAAYLAGRLPRGPVLVLERREKIGGVCATDELYPGFRYTTAAQVLSLLRPQIIRDLKLHEHGYRFIPMTSSFTPFSDGRSLLLGLGDAQDRAAIAAFSERDAARWPRYEHTMGRLAAAIRPILDAIPPDIGRIGARDLVRGGLLAIAMRRLGRFERAQLVKLLSMSAAAFVDEWFESPQLRAHLAAPGTIGLWGSPRTPGTASVLMHFALGEIGGAPGTWGFVRGGMGSLADALAAAAVSRGAEIRTAAPVRRVISEDQRARGVELEDGTVLETDIVVSGVDLGVMVEQEL